MLKIGEPIPANPGCPVIRRMVQSNPVYAAMIWNLDENIGRLMDALRESGKADDTLIVFTSDNGGLSTAEGSPTCNLPAKEGKGWMYEGGTRFRFLSGIRSLSNLTAAVGHQLRPRIFTLHSLI